jgi:stearoyl-CoA desaturase (Delta-9 desaturase)
VINGVGHWFGYKNGETRDQSRNIVPWGILIGGEELHNNHHINPASPKLSRRWFEFDLGWMYIQIFKTFKLLSIRNEVQ